MRRNAKKRNSQRISANFCTCSLSLRGGLLAGAIRALIVFILSKISLQADERPRAGGAAIYGPSIYIARQRLFVVEQKLSSLCKGVTNRVTEVTTREIRSNILQPYNGRTVGSGFRRLAGIGKGWGRSRIGSLLRTGMSALRWQ
jgi:hypothetical protein